MPPTAPQDHRTSTKKSGKRASRPVSADDAKYMPTAWGGSSDGLEDLVTPSGQLCLVKRPGVQRLMEAGVLRDIDTLSAIVNEAHIKRVNGEKQVDTDSLSGDPEALANVVHVVDRVIVHCVVKPPIKMAPNDETSRKPDVVYADMIDIEDKMFIFQYAVGGTRSVEQFRTELQSAMGSVDAEPEAGGSTE